MTRRVIQLNKDPDALAAAHAIIKASVVGVLVWAVVWWVV